MSRCFPPDVADGFLRGRLSDEAFTQALKHAAGCADCRYLLFSTSRPDPDVQSEGMDQIQDRLTDWRAARRAPLMPAFPWHKGQEVDRYVIIRSVGGTEDGVIYEAYDAEREERVVVKQLDLRATDPGAPVLMATAQKLCQLQHPNVLQMMSVGVHAGYVYVVYEFVRGTPLSHAGSDDPHQLIELYTAAARGLAAAHEAGIVHGCFSAASCVVGRDGRVRVLDFGIGEARIRRTPAKPHVDDDWTTAVSSVHSEDSFVGFVPSRRLPTSGQYESIVLAAGPNSLGPRIYAAPELVLGAAPSPASDQFALCAALFHRLYGHPPFDGDTIALWLRQLLKSRVAKPPARANVPDHVQSALLRGLERDPSMRFDRMESLVARFERHRPMLSGRRRVLTAVATGAAFAVAGVVVAGALRSGSAGARDTSCDRALAGWSNLWSASRQDDLTRLSGNAGDAWPVLRTRFDAWVGAWRDATHNFCSVPERGPALDCTARAHTAASDLLDLVASDAPGRLVRAAAAAEALPTFDQCTSAIPSPASAPVAAVQADVRRRLGMLDEADQLTAKALDEPAQRGYQSLVRGHTAADRGDLIEARRLFENATFEAGAAHQPELAVTAAVQRLALSCSVAERALWSGYVAAQLQLGSHAVAQTGYRSALASSLACEGKLGESLALRQQVAQALYGDNTAIGGAAALDLARTQLAQGDLSGAESSARTATAIYSRLYGSRHPLAQTARLTVAEAGLSSANAAQAAVAIEGVLAELADRKDPDAVRAHALFLQGRLADARGHRDEAQRLIARASQEYETALGSTHPELAAALLAAGDLQLAAGRDREAETSYRQVAAIFDTLGQSESAQLAHARAGVQLAHWGAQLPADARDILQWGLAPTGDAIDPSVEGWVSEQLGRRAATRGDRPAALAHYRAAASAWQQSGDHRGLGAALTEGALLAAELNAGDARALLEQALQSSSVGDRPRLRGALGKLLWPSQRDRATTMVRAALNDLPENSDTAADLKRWLARHDER